MPINTLTAWHELVRAITLQDLTAAFRDFLPLQAIKAARQKMVAG